MRSLWKCGLALMLGLLANGVRGGEEAWRPAGAGAPSVTRTGAGLGSAVSLGQPVSLGRPVPLPATMRDALGGTPITDAALRPTAFLSPAGNGPGYRSASGMDAGLARPMPVGPGDGNPSITSWARAAEPVPPTEHAPPPTLESTDAGPPIASGGPGPIWGCFSHACNPCPDSCGMPSCCCPSGCGCGGNRWYVSADYLLWWMKASPTPILVTTGNPADGAFAGALGRPGTAPLFGGQNVGTEVRSGGRINFGYWFTDDHCIGLDFGGLFLGSQGDNFSASSRGALVLARPFFDTVQSNAEAIANLSQGVAGAVAVHQRSNLWGAEANVRSNLWCGCLLNVDVLAGFRTLGLDESLEVNERLVVLGNTTATTGLGGSRIDVNDMFKTSNRFYGGQIGAVAELRKGRWILDLTTKVALGSTQEQVDISGATAMTPVVNGVTGATASGAGGLLTGATTNIGRFTRDKFSVVPEVGLQLGYQCCDHLRLFVGYNFLYWSDVARPGQQIDPTVNPQRVFGSTMAVGPARPAFVFRDSDFWAQGINFGFEFRY